MAQGAHRYATPQAKRRHPSPQGVITENHPKGTRAHVTRNFIYLWVDLMFWNKLDGVPESTGPPAVSFQVAGPNMTSTGPSQ